MNLTKPFNGPNPYRDIYIRIVVSLIASHFIVAFAREEKLIEMLKLWEYHRDFGLNFLMAYLLITYINRVSWALDGRHPWKYAVKKRLRLQLLWGFMGALVLDFFLAIIFFLLHEPGTLELYFPDYLRFDYPVIGLMLFIVNGYYFAYYWVADYLRLPDNQRLQRSTILVKDGNHNIPVKLSSIAYIFHEGDYNFLRTFEGMDYVLTQKLDEVMKLLDKGYFFKANRQFIVHHQACRQLRSKPDGAVVLYLEPPYKDDIKISQDVSRKFKNWLKDHQHT